MTADNNQTSSPLTRTQKQGAFSANISHDQTLDTTVISLRYSEPANPAHSISLGIAADLGANMFRFRVGEHEIIHCETELLKRRDFTGNFPLWPLPNRTRDKTYVYQGQTYSLKGLKRPQGNEVLVHGLVFDRSWQYEQPVQNSDSVSVRTFIDITPASPFYEGYPFDSRLSLTYTLTANSVTTTYEVKNNGTKDLPYGFAMHPYFSLLSGSHETLVSFPADDVMEADEELLPTGRLLSTTRGIMYAMFNLQEPTPIAPLKLDHVYTGLHKGKAATIEYRQQKMKLHATTSDDFTHIVIYAPGGTPYFCLENQTCSTDAVNLHHRGLNDIAHLLEVRPGETATGFIRYSIEYTD
jgi:aldose 1-epimerase